MPKYSVPIYAVITHEIRADIEVEADNPHHAMEEALSQAEYDHHQHDWNDTLGSFDVGNYYADMVSIKILDND